VLSIRTSRLARFVAALAQQLDRRFEHELADTCGQHGLTVAQGLKRIGGRTLERRAGQPIEHPLAHGEYSHVPS
jgi:hypothetical protein